MTKNVASLSDALNVLKLNNSTAITQTFNTAGISPNSLSAHVEKTKYLILGITPEEFIKRHGAITFDFIDLMRKFKKICRDFDDPINMQDDSKAVEFCSKILYEVGPEARQVKKKDGDKTWKFIFMYNDSGNLVCKTAFVSTFKDDGNSYNLEADDSMISLSVKNASLLALVTLNALNELSSGGTNGIYLLTPLGGAVFSRDDLANISTKTGEAEYVIANKINSSAQSGGQYLDTSSMAVAALAAIVATRNVKHVKMRDGIVGRTLKQYVNAKKQWSDLEFEAYAEFAHGGVPSNISPKNLIQLFESIQKVTPLAALKHAKQTLMTSNVLSPAGSVASMITPVQKSAQSQTLTPAREAELKTYGKGPRVTRAAVKDISGLPTVMQDWMVYRGMCDANLSPIGKIDVLPSHPSYASKHDKLVKTTLDSAVKQWNALTKEAEELTKAGKL